MDFGQRGVILTLREVRSFIRKLYIHGWARKKKPMRHISWIALAIICMAGCTSRAGKDQHVNAGEDTTAVLKVALTAWYSSGSPFSPVESGVVRIHCSDLAKSELVDISGLKTIVIPLKDAQLDDPDPNPKGHWVRVKELTISGDNAQLRFHAKNAEYHKWASAFYKLHRSDKGWTISNFGADM